MAEAPVPDGKTEYPICELSGYQSDSSHYTCKKDELFESSGNFLRFFGKKTGATNEVEVRKKYNLLRQKNKAKYDLGDNINIDFENKQWHITKKAEQENEFGDDRQYDSLDSDEDIKLIRQAKNNINDPLNPNRSKSKYDDCIRRFGPKLENATKAKLCSILTFAYVLEDKKSVRALGFSNDKLVEIANDMMHVWYNDNTVIYQIYKTLSEAGSLCFLPMVYLFFDKEMANVEIYFSIQETLGETLGLGPITPFDWLTKSILKKKIQECKMPTMAIPLSFQTIGVRGSGHANMLVINRRIKVGKRSFEVEHFEPHVVFLRDEKKSSMINNAVDGFISKLFNDEEYTIIHPQQLCPQSRPMQALLGTSTTYGGSCAIFAMWYGLIRLLNPTGNPIKINALISQFLEQNQEPEKIMRQIVRTFTELVTIDLVNRTVNGRPFSRRTVLGGKKNYTKLRRPNKSQKKLLKRNTRKNRAKT